jgi:Tol biopolymer transport system component
VNVRRLLVLLVLCVAVVPASSATASYPGAVGRIVFTSDRVASSTSEVYSSAPDGTDVRRLTWTEGFEQDPAWSPDGSRIAYESSDQGRFRVFVMNQDGSDQHKISPDTPYSTIDDWQPAWSPDGTQIAFASTRPTGNAWHLWVMNADGTNLHMLPTAFAQHPVWSPDGLRIAGDSGTGPLFVINADGTNERQLTTPSTDRYDESPDWSPDGTSLVFSERTLDGTSSALYATDVDGSGRRQLTSGAYSDYAPSWSPDGTGVVFNRRTVANGSFQLYTVGAGGGAAIQLLSSIRNDMGPSWGSSTVSPVASPPGAPQVRIFSPVDGGLYFPGATDGVFYSCSSAVSFVMQCTGSQHLGAVVDTSFAGLHQFSVTATDLEGRQTTETISYTVLDLTPPTITVHTPFDGATYDVGESATVEFACSDGIGGSGIFYCAGTRPNGVPVDTTRAGSFTFEVTALDNAHNFKTVTTTYRVVDPTPPSITIAVPANQRVYTQDQVVGADYTCTGRPDGSGVASCNGSVASGGAIDTATVGDHTFTVTTSDGSHHTATASVGYTVVYDFSGFFSPVAAPPMVNSRKAGEGIPLKFSLHGDRGSDVFAAGSPAWAACESPTATAASGALSYNASQARYTFLASTDKSWAGACKDLIVTLRDGTTHRARFAFGK